MRAYIINSDRKETETWLLLSTLKIIPCIIAQYIVVGTVAPFVNLQVGTMQRCLTKLKVEQLKSTVQTVAPPRPGRGHAPSFGVPATAVVKMYRLILFPRSPLQRNGERSENNLNHE